MSVAANPLNDTAFIVAHYSPSGRVAENLRNMIEYLSKSGAKIVFVSTGLSSTEITILSQWAIVKVRENIGYDFWSYKTGIDMLENLYSLKRLVLFNSSIFINNPSMLCERFFRLSGTCDLLSLTQCGVVAPHLQSFWICFDNPDILRSESFVNWWGSMVPISEKDEVIKQYEVGMTAHFATSGFRLASAFTRDRQLDLLATMRGIESGILPLNLSPSGPLQLDPLLGQPLDPTHYTWEALFEQFGVLKLILLKINPAHVNLAAMDRFLSGNDELRRLLTDALSS